MGEKDPRRKLGNPPPNMDNPSSDEEDEEPPTEILRDHKTLRYRTPPTEVPPSPKRHCYQTLGIPGDNIAFLPRRIAATITEIQNTIHDLTKKRYSHSINGDNVPFCKDCKTNHAVRVWKDLARRPLCAPCRTSRETTHFPRYFKPAKPGRQRKPPPQKTTRGPNNMTAPPLTSAPSAPALPNTRM